MNRQRHSGRDRRPSYRGGIGDGLLGEGPGYGGGGGSYEPMVNSQVSQLLLMQQLLQQQAGLSRAGGYGDGSLGNISFLQQQSQGYSGGMGGRNVGGMRNDRKRLSGNGRDNDFKRRRYDSPGRGGDRDRSRGRDSGRSGESRDRKHNSRWDSDRDRDDVYNPAEPTDDDVHDRDSNLYCHVCNKTLYDEESFRRHLNSPKHTQLMNSVLTMHQMKSNQLKFRIKAEEHLRKIEGGRGGLNPDYFCKICNNSLTIPWERHRFSKIHTQRQLQVTRGCGWCKVHDFKNFTEVLEHRETDEHKKNAEIFGKKKDEKERRRSRSRSRDRRSEKHRRRSTSRDRSRREKEREQKAKKKQEDEEDLTIPEYNAEKTVGLSYIVPVTGFFCKLCHKFYNNEKSAKGAHCQSETHYEKFKLATEAKIAAREKRLAEEAAAEAEKKANEESKDVSSTEKEDNKQESEATEENKKEKEERVEEDIDEEDYDDPLPMEDLDDDGGLAKDDDFGLLDDDDDVNITADSGLNDTDANSSFVYLSGEMAEAQVEINRKELNEQKEIEDKSEQNESDPKTDVVTELKVEENVPTDEKQEDSLVTSDNENEGQATPAASEPVKAAAKTRGSGTARRGRGRGRGKK
ncbi:zinc finger protein on ecdysone puffs-like [Biomphalaria glabrata]|uniref:Zinc finger protein on ecdysone puffs-like n=1 Tax=Biomphalaria glabrata TaxID=6526 RepID=A0A9U8EE31_BIOGL|nr:zinc finger protein on ecdysone puffs-like [Biomphalaria glabrata]XP_055897644.1 zinc finger protein on ecdysone puffs-like [Biomphalaria glabrata]KAI8779439.1 zinc finger protein on ecdysone puffs [Biomphalaria glabrata]